MNANNLIRIKSLILIMLVFNVISCSKPNKSIQREIIVDNYSIEIELSSFWNCGVFKKYVVNNLSGQDPSTKRNYEKFHLYTIEIKSNCKPPFFSDTLRKELSKGESDSLFELSNKFVNNFKITNHIKSNQSLDNGVLDGANLKVEICLMNKCKSATYYNYGHLKEISPEMKNLIEYIDLLNKTKH